MLLLTTRKELVLLLAGGVGFEQRDLKRGTILSALDFHIGEKDEFKALTKLRST